MVINEYQVNLGDESGRLNWSKQMKAFPEAGRTNRHLQTGSELSARRHKTSRETARHLPDRSRCSGHPLPASLL